MRWPGLKLHRYPIWSAKSVALLAGVTVAATAVLVFAVSGKPVLSELQTTLAVLAVALFLFLTVGLYHGVRFKKEPLANPGPTLVQAARKAGQMVDGSDVIDAADVGSRIGLEAAASEWGCLVGCGLSVVVLFGLLILTALWDAGCMFVIPLAFYWLFSRALRQVFIHAAKCHGSIARSLQYASGYTVLYTGWMFALLALAKRL
jgi:hypothetical protein